MMVIKPCISLDGKYVYIVKRKYCELVSSIVNATKVRKRRHECIILSNRRVTFYIYEADDKVIEYVKELESEHKLKILGIMKNGECYYIATDRRVSSAK